MGRLYRRGQISEENLERKIEERTIELRMSEKKYRVLVENSPNLVLILQEGVLKYVNKAICDKLGWTFEEMTSPSFKPLEKVFPERTRVQLEKNTAKRLRGARH